MTVDENSSDDEAKIEPSLGHHYHRTDFDDVTTEKLESKEAEAAHDQMTTVSTAKAAQPEAENSEDADDTVVILDSAPAIEDAPDSTPEQTAPTAGASQPKTPKNWTHPKRRKKSFWTLKRFFLALLTATIVIGGGLFGVYTYFAETNQFPIKTIKVIGEYQYVKEADIVKILKPFIVDKGLFAFSEWKAEAALEKIPGVADASIWRIPPDKIKVIIRERSAVARFPNGALLSSKGVVFTTSNVEGAADLPLLNGDIQYGKEMLAMLESLEPIFGTINAKVTGLGLAANGDWSVQLNNQTWIMLGKNDLTDRVQDFLTAYPELMKSAAPGAKLSYVDLRYSNGFAASWIGGTANS